MGVGKIREGIMGYRLLYLKSINYKGIFKVIS